MGPVAALTTSNNARNVIREEAARQAGREDLTPVAAAPGSLIVVDEASMVPMGNLAAVVVAPTGTATRWR
jgi:hypothetical protein